MSESCDGECIRQCVGCGGHIQDQFILRVSPDLSWHQACLKCSECQMFLDENHTCFVRDGKTYCKKDYVRLYSARCSACHSVFTKNDFVMRAKTKMFHLECFRCAVCSRHLVPGDEFAMRGECIYCKEDHEILHNSDKTEDNNNINIKNEMEENNEDNEDIKSETSTIRPESPDGVDVDLLDVCPPVDDLSMKEGRPKGPGKGRSTRARTVLTEKQRNILTTCFQHNPKPDALLKDQLVEMTGLTARVIRVWFQNKRCKEHKRIKAAVLVNRKDRKFGYNNMNGTPMVAGSPVRHESPLVPSPVEIQSYHPPWKALTDYALRNDIERLEPGTNSHFSSIVSQMHGFDPQYGGPPSYHELYHPHPNMSPHHHHLASYPGHDGARLTHDVAHDGLLVKNEGPMPATHDIHSPALISPNDGELRLNSTKPNLDSDEYVMPFMERDEKGDSET